MLPSMVRDYLALRSPSAICDACIAKVLDAEPSRVNLVTRCFAVTSDFERTEGQCGDCSNQRLRTGSVLSVSNRTSA